MSADRLPHLEPKIWTRGMSADLLPHLEPKIWQHGMPADLVFAIFFNFNFNLRHITSNNSSFAA